MQSLKTLIYCHASATPLLSEEDLHICVGSIDLFFVSLFCMFCVRAYNALATERSFVLCSFYLLSMICLLFCLLFFVFYGLGRCRRTWNPSCCFTLGLHGRWHAAIVCHLIPLPYACSRNPGVLSSVFPFSIPVHLVYRPYYCTSRKSSLQGFSLYLSEQSAHSLCVWGSPVAFRFSVFCFFRFGPASSTSASQWFRSPRASNTSNTSRSALFWPLVIQERHKLRSVACETMTSCYLQLTE